MSRAMLLTVLFWAVLTVGYGYATVSTKLALPETPESYANGVGFQVWQFIYFKLPGLLILLLLALSTQLFLEKLRRSQLPSWGRKLLRYSLVAGIGMALLFAVWHSTSFTTTYNPYFEPEEQVALHFITSWLPLLAIVMVGILVSEYRG
jgi:hypothetical protein